MKRKISATLDIIISVTWKSKKAVQKKVLISSDATDIEHYLFELQFISFLALKICNWQIESA